MICFGAHKSPPLVPTLSHINPVHCNIILPYILRSSKWSLSLRVFPQKSCTHARTHLSSSTHGPHALLFSTFVISSPESYSVIFKLLRHMLLGCSMTGYRTTYMGLRYNSVYYCFRNQIEAHHNIAFRRFSSNLFTA